MADYLIPFTKPVFGDQEVQSVLNVLDVDTGEPGSLIDALEREFAAWCETRYAIAADSGTSALLVALMAHGIGEGDEVITSAFTSLATINAILAARAIPVFVDIDEQTYVLDVGQVESAITARAKAIVPVHLFGHLCDMRALTAIAHEHDLLIVEDVCQALGASLEGRKAGSFGTGAFSFADLSGRGGMITTNDEDIARRCREIRHQGLDSDGCMVSIGLQFEMQEIHAALVRARLPHLDEDIRRRREIAAYFNRHLAGVETPVERSGYRHVWSKYTLRVPEGVDRQTFLNQLRAAGIAARVYYPSPVYQLTYIREIGGDVHCPVTEQVSHRVLSLPIYPLLTQDEVEKIVIEVNRLV